MSAEWVPIACGRVLVVQAYGDLDADGFRDGRLRIAEASSANPCDRLLVDMRAARVLLTMAELRDVIRESSAVSYLQPVGMLVPPGFDALAHRHSLGMAVHGVSRLWWTDAAEALAWTKLSALPPLRNPGLPGSG